MQTKLLFIVLLLVSTYSCQSEYQRQMEKAKLHMESLNMQLNDVQATSDDAEIEKVKKDINFCAEMSGNKKLFLKELQFNVND